jgi:hypothetical protein
MRTKCFRFLMHDAVEDGAIWTDRFWIGWLEVLHWMQLYD